MTDKLSAAKGEALICRAYAHFVLVNVFCQHYDPAHPDDLGIPYMEKAETELDPKYERGTVAEVLGHFRTTEPKGEFVIVLAGKPKPGRETQGDGDEQKIGYDE